MTDPEGHDPVLSLIDALAAGVLCHLGRRAEDGDATSVVLQLGEEGRLRLPRPDPESPGSLPGAVRAIQEYVLRERGERVPRCPVHGDHALALEPSADTWQWACPAAEWRCGCGEFAETAWPHFPPQKLAPMLSRRLARRDGTGVRQFGVSADSEEIVASFAVADVTPGLIRVLEEAAAPLRAEVREMPRHPRQPVAPVDQAPGRQGPVRLVLDETTVTAGSPLGFTVVNDSERPILIGVGYAIDQEDGGWWHAIDPERAFVAVGIVVAPGDGHDLVATVPGRAVPGRYRLRTTARARAADAEAGVPFADQFELTAQFRVAPHA